MLLMLKHKKNERKYIFFYIKAKTIFFIVTSRFVYYFIFLTHILHIYSIFEMKAKFIIYVSLIISLV